MTARTTLMTRTALATRTTLLARDGSATRGSGSTVDTTGPVLSAIVATPSETGCVITWTTDEPADSQIEYGTTTSYGTTTGLIVSLSTSHQVTLTDLNGSLAGTLYHYRIRSRDAAGNLCTLSDRTFTTVGIAAPPRSPTDQLADPFGTNGAPNPAIWAPFGGSSAADTQIANKRFEIKLPNSLSGSTRGITTITTWDLTTLLVKIAQFPKNVTGLEGSVVLTDLVSGDVLRLRWGLLTFRVETVIGGTTTLLYSRAASLAAAINDNRWWRISESSGTITVQIGRRPSALTTVATFVAPISVAQLTVTLQGATTASVSNPGYMMFDSVNSPTTAATFGSLVLKPLYTAIDYYVPFTGDDEQYLRSNRPTVEYKLHSEPTIWTTVRPAWVHYQDEYVMRSTDPVDYGTHGLAGSVLGLVANTSYDLRISGTDDDGNAILLTGTVSTRADAITDLWPGGVAVGADYYVNEATGSDGAAGTSGAPFASLNKALAVATAGQKIRVDSQYCRQPTTKITAGVTIFSKVPATDATGYATGDIAAGASGRTIMEPSNAAGTRTQVVGPSGDATGLPSDQLGVWTPATLTGPVLGGSYSVWKWTVNRTAIFDPNSYDPNAAHYTAVRTTTPRRLIHWLNNQSNTLATYGTRGKPNDNPKSASQWIERATLNQTTTITRVGGFFRGPATYDPASPTADPTSYIWCIMPSDAASSDPNDSYISFSAGSNSANPLVWMQGASGARLSGFELRGGYVGVMMSAGAADCIVDRNTIVVGHDGVLFFTADMAYASNPIPALSYVLDPTVERNRFLDSMTSTLDPVGTPAIAWNSVKISIEQPASVRSTLAADNAAANNATNLRWAGDILKKQESTAVTHDGGAWQAVVRHNRIDGPFNGIGAFNTFQDRFGTWGQHIHNNWLSNVADDAFEPEGQAIAWKILNNRLEHTITMVSLGPVCYGPMYVVGNSAWRCGNLHVVGEDSTEASGNRPDGRTSKPTGSAYKCELQLYPPPEIVDVGNTYWTDAPSHSVWVGDAQGPETNIVGGSMDTGPFWFTRNSIYRVTRYLGDLFHMYYAAEGQWDEDYNALATSDTTRGLSIATRAGAIATYGSNVAAYRTAMTAGAHSQPHGGDFVTVASIDALLTDPVNGDLTLKSGTNALKSAGVAVPGIVSGTPNLGYIP